MSDLSERRSLHSGIERRSVPFRLVDDGYTFRGTGATAEGWTLSAHAAVTGIDYQVRDKFGLFTEHLHPGSFRDTLARGADVNLLTNHDGLSLARTRSGTLRLAEDSRGLRYEADLDPANPHSQALRSAIERGDVDESSFSFKAVRETWNSDYSRRDLYAVDINKGDVSPVNYGANPATGNPGSAVSLRSEYRGASDYVGLTDAIKAKFVSDLQNAATNPTVHVAQWLHRCNQWAASTYPKGLTYGDVRWMAAQCVKELKRRDPHSTASMDGFPGPSAGSEAVGPSDQKAAYFDGEHRCQAGQAALAAAGELKEGRMLGRLGEYRGPTFVGCNCCGPCTGAGCDGSCCDSCPADTLKAAGAFLSVYNSDTSSDSMDQPSAEALALAKESLELRRRILRLKVGAEEFRAAERRLRAAREPFPGESAGEFARRRQVDAIIAKRRREVYR